jgi:2-keto-4-pentenoate hydratase/2-oxohepta-3-ene-1,7-dioic acid hydratase in catechol pathway
MNYTGDLSDCGNEIGIIIGEKYKNMTEDETQDFISGIKHGISLTNGTH